MVIRSYSVPARSEKIQNDAMHRQAPTCTDMHRNEELSLSGDVNRRICRSRPRVGWCETSARLFAYRSVSWLTEGMIVPSSAL